MPKVDPKIIRVGDRAKIIDPLMFIRCGYPLCLADIEKSPEFQSIEPKIEEFWDNLGLSPQEKESSLVRKAVLRCLLRKSGFGGKERKIITKEVPGLKGATISIVRKKNVKTGIYERGSRDYEGDYSPPYLSNEKTHVICQFVIDYFVEDKGWSILDLDIGPCSYEIESRHLEKIYTTK